MKLGVKISLLILPMVVVSLLILGWIAYSQLQENAKRNIISQLATYSDQIQEHYSSKLKTAIANIQLFSNHNSVFQYALTSDPDARYSLIQKPMLKQFSRFHNAFPDYYEFRFILPDGFEDARWTSEYIENSSEDESESAQFNKMKIQDDNIYYSTYINPDNNLPALWVSKRIKLRNPSLDALTKKPQLRGYLVITSSLDFLINQINQVKIGKYGFFVVTDKNAQLLFSPQDTDHTSYIDQSNKTLKISSAEWKNSISNPDKIHPGSFTHDNYLLSVKSLEDNLILVGILPEKELSQASSNISNAVILVTLTTIILSTSIILLVLRHLMLKPIQHLNEATKEIARGTSITTIDINSTDELGQLARSFEAMAYTLKRSSDQVKFLAYHDSLTGLPNRLMFKEYLVPLLARAKRHQEIIALLFLDLDNFKKINDSLGHLAGDKLLQEVATRLSNCLRNEDYISISGFDDTEDNDIIARLGGDEFIILLSTLKHSYEASQVAKRILKALEEPVILDGHEVYISSSIGITVSPYDGDSADVLIKNADIAMYHAKESGKNVHRFYSEALNETAQLKLTLENKLRKALKNEEFLLYYQPQVNSFTGELVGLEALIRWIDPDSGMVAPDAFIPLAEETGLITPITEWVVMEACRQNKMWQHAGLASIPVSVNISGIDFSHQNIKDLIHTSLQHTGLAAEYLEVEITETTLMADQKNAIKTLNSLRDLGVAIAMDDFGTGYSSLSYLMQFPIQTLKIDRSFIVDIVNNKTHAAIIASVIDMAHAIGLRVVAEGIENREQLQLLINYGCDVAQGYYFSRPLDTDAIMEILRTKNIINA